MQNFRIAICLAGITLILLLILDTIKIVNNFYYFRTVLYHRRWVKKEGEIFLNLESAICRKAVFWGLANEIEKFDQFQVHSRNLHNSAEVWVAYTEYTIADSSVGGGIL
jgi:hypothetical protein